MQARTIMDVADHAEWPVAPTSAARVMVSDDMPLSAHRATRDTQRVDRAMATSAMVSTELTPKLNEPMATRKVTSTVRAVHKSVQS